MLLLYEVYEILAENNLNSNLEIYRQTLSAGDTQSSWQIERINENTSFSFYASVYGIAPTEVSVSGNTVTATWDAQDSDIEVGVRIDG